MKKNIFISVLFTVFICVQTKAQPTMTKDETANNIKTISLGINQFGNELLENYADAQDGEDKNIFFSPISIVNILSMVGEGAKGRTKDEIKKTLHLHTNDIENRLGFKGLLTDFNTNNNDYQLIMANAMWIQNDYSLSDSFLQIVKTNYDANAQNVNFKSQPEATRHVINNWVETNTKNKIKGLLGKNDIDDKTELVLTNTIYFKGDWQNGFNVAATQDADFTTTNGNIIKAKMMHVQRDFNYHETAGVQILEMPYKGNQLSMVVLLPKKGGGMQSIINAKNLTSLLGNNDVGNSLVNVSFPKFKFETKYDLIAPLKKLGITTAFEKIADFSGITVKKDLYINKVIHQTFVDVTEVGTEAAAATGGAMRSTSIMQRPKEPIIFNADHPFVFAIKDNIANIILFIGIMNNPNRK